MAIGEINVIYVPLGATPPANQFVICAPSDSKGGGFTIVDAYVINPTTTSGTASFTVALHRYNGAGAQALAGTIAAARGGASDHFTANTPKQFTINSSDQFIDAGEYVVVNYAAVAGGAPTVGGAVIIEYQMGK